MLISMIGGSWYASLSFSLPFPFPQRLFLSLFLESVLPISPSLSPPVPNPALLTDPPLPPLAAGRHLPLPSLHLPDDQVALPQSGAGGGTGHREAGAEEGDEVRV